MRDANQLMNTWPPLRATCLACASLVLSACGGGSSSPQQTPPPPEPETFSVGGTVQGLRSGTLTLREASGDELEISSNGVFTIIAGAASGRVWEVSIAAQPESGPVQICEVANGAGTIAGASVNSIDVSCRYGVGRYLYVPASGSSSLFAYSIDRATGSLAPVIGSPFAGPSLPGNRSYHHYFAHAIDNRYIYVMALSWDPAQPDDYSYQLTGFAIDSDTGALTQIAETPRYEAESAGDFVIHPSGQYLVFSYFEMTTNLFTLTDDQMGVRALRIDSATGALTEVDDSPFPRVTGNFGPAPGVFSVSGERYYTYGFRRDEGSQLTTTAVSWEFDASTGNMDVQHWEDLPILEDPWISGSGARSVGGIAMDPTGQYVVLTHSSYGAGHSPSTPNVAGGITVASIDALSGQLQIDQHPGHVVTLNGVSTPLFAEQAGARVIVPSAPNLSIGTVNAGSVTVLDVDPGTRSLTEVSGSPFPTNGTNMRYPLLDSTGSFFVATNVDDGTVAVLELDAATGALAHFGASPVLPAIGASPIVTVDPSASYAYVVDSDTASVSSYRLDFEAESMSFVTSETAGPGLHEAIVIGIQ